MVRWEDFVVVAALVLPWVGIAIVILIQSHLVDRIGVLEREVVALKDRVTALTADLGWKQE